MVHVPNLYYLHLLCNFPITIYHGTSFSRSEENLETLVEYSGITDLMCIANALSKMPVVLVSNLNKRVELEMSG